MRHGILSAGSQIGRIESMLRLNPPVRIRGVNGTRRSKSPAGQLVLGLVLLGAVLGVQTTAAQEGFNVAEVKYFDRFSGTERELEVLKEHGFVVTRQHFKQIFEPYLSRGLGIPGIPHFITTDSAWHTYHVLFEDVFRAFEENYQVDRLQEFSKQLCLRAVSQSKKEGRRALRARLAAVALFLRCGGRPSVIERPLSDKLFAIAHAHADFATAYADLARFAAVGMALQDPDSLLLINEGDRHTVEEAIRTIHQPQGVSRVLFFDLAIDTARFQPQGFYADRPRLGRYFTARRWYSSCAFTVESPGETLRAVLLAELISSDPTLAHLYQKLTRPYEEILGPEDDLGVAAYAAMAKDVRRSIWPEELSLETIGDFQNAAVASRRRPVVNDQPTLTSPILSFRLFGPRRLPSAELFEQTTHPVVTGRWFPSGLDFFTAGPMACQAGVRATATSPYAQKISRAQISPLPATLHGRALQLLKELNKPVPASGPQVFRTDAWGDKQLWTTLGAWVEMRHTWALHAKTNNSVWGIMLRSPGYVSPYPSFFSGLAKLARETATLMDRHGEIDVDAERAVQLLHRGALAFRRVYGYGAYATYEDWQVLSDLESFLREYEQTTGATKPLNDGDWWAAELEVLAEKWSTAEALSPTDEHMARLVLPPLGRGVEMLPQFASLCDELAAIAVKELNGESLDEHDGTIIQQYGDEIAHFHFYDGNEVIPRDDFPMMAELYSVFDQSGGGEALYAGVARPEALFVILEHEGVPVLHRGAVLSYRQMQRAVGALPNDVAWRESLDGPTPPSAPAFTMSFRPPEQQSGPRD